MRLFVYDWNMEDERAKITIDKLAAMSDIVASEKQYIRWSGQGEITILGGNVIAVGENLFKTTETRLTQRNLYETSSFEQGADYYIYIFATDDQKENERYVISKGTPFPPGEGWDETKARKIGGFHYGYVRNTNKYGQEVGADNVCRSTGWESNVRADIVPNSVWTTKHRPTCDPTGMVYLGSSLWGDVYTASEDSAEGFQSTYNQRPMDGITFYEATLRAARVGKRLPSLAEFLVGAEGSPQGLDESNENGWTAKTNKNNTPVGLIRNAVSNRNVMDLCGNVSKWLDELVLSTATTSWAWYNQHETSGKYGQVYMPSDIALRAIIAGGNRDEGVRCGARAFDCNSPTDHRYFIGAWCVCNSL